LKTDRGERYFTKRRNGRGRGPKKITCERGGGGGGNRRGGESNNKNEKTWDQPEQTAGNRTRI